MVDDAVDHRGGDDLVAEDAGPGAERQVGRQDQGGVLVPGGDELEEEVGGVLLEGQVADLIDDDQPAAPQSGELLWESSSAVGIGESGDLQSEASVGPTRSGGPKDFLNHVSEVRILPGPPPELRFGYRVHPDSASTDRAKTRGSRRRGRLSTEMLDLAA